MNEYSTKYLVKIGIFSLILTVASITITYGIIATIEWIQEGGIRDLKAKITEKKEAKKASKYVTKTLESK